MQQNIQNYLTQLLTKSGNHTLAEHEQSLLQHTGIEEFVYARLTSKKFRKSKMDEACVERTKKAIAIQVQKSEPINVFYPQGGYKLWRFPSSPTVDWAEFFNISYVLAYVAPIAAAYKPGVKITYYMHTLLMELHDNLTTEEIQAYVASFEALLTEFRKYLPDNITVSILRDADIYSRDEYFKALEKGKSQAEKEYVAWNQAQKNDFARMARLNIKWNGKEDWTNLSDKDKEEKIYLAALYEATASSNLPKVAELVKSPDKILVFTKGNAMFIGIGSTKASIAKYWVGFGVLEKQSLTYLPIVLTPSQYEKAMKEKHERISTNVISLTNFSEVLVFDKPFTFAI